MISIIIPVLNEEKNLSRLLHQLTQLEGTVPYEVIVVDGGSQDQTVAIAKRRRSFISWRMPIAALN